MNKSLKTIIGDVKKQEDDEKSTYSKNSRKSDV
jgi:hypothetical protein